MGKVYQGPLYFGQHCDSIWWFGTAEEHADRTWDQPTIYGIAEVEPATTAAPIAWEKEFPQRGDLINMGGERYKITAIYIQDIHVHWVADEHLTKGATDNLVTKIASALRFPKPKGD